MSGILAFIKDLYVNPFQFRKLSTHEDGSYFHMHKTFGILALCSFGYRAMKFIHTGDMGFDSSWSTLGWIAAHAGLHLSSFEFILPSRRNKVYNVIWPEFRWHSMIFSYRSLLINTAIWLSCNGHITPELTLILRPAIVMLTLYTADIVTDFFKKNDLVDKDDSTMRGNPYPHYVPQWYIKYHNLFYSIAQVMATMNILFRSFESIYLLLIAIQTAPFCMTLVKKGIISQAGWHMIYTLALLSNFLHGYIIPNDHTYFLFWKLSLLFCVGRFGLRLNKYWLWALVIALQWRVFKYNDDIYQTMLGYSTLMKPIPA